MMDSVDFYSEKFPFHHRLPGCFIWGSFPGKTKKSLLPLPGEQGQNLQILRYHLVCRLQIDRSARCQHTVCPITQALRQRILGNPFSLPSAAHLLLRFSPRSQLCGTLCGCAGSFTSASSVCLLNLESLYTRKVRLSRTFFHDTKISFSCFKKIIFSIPGQRPLRAPESGHGCHRWGHSSRFPA